jgi:hypothetical protein
MSRNRREFLKQVWLKPGDKLTKTIGNLGTLRFSLT